MSRGLSKRQNQLLAFLAVAKRPVELTGEAREWLAEPGTKSAKASLIRAARSLEQRGLVTITSAPNPRGGRGKLIATIVDGAEGELTAPDLQRARRQERPS